MKAAVLRSLVSIQSVFNTGSDSNDHLIDNGGSPGWSESLGCGLNSTDINNHSSVLNAKSSTATDLIIFSRTVKPVSSAGARRMLTTDN
jgi:hypothetical protein